ncbi:MAG: ABC transporter permease [Candidatus Aminicenantes bacterium]|nr:MAG: ABC transporter permease [Candidatus Aminicenantes bacterium]
MKKNQTKIPGLALWLLRHVLPKQDFIFLNGNFEDMYKHRIHTEGRFKTGIWIWSEIIKSLPGFLYVSFYWRMMMFKNYFIMTLRNIRKHTLHSVINIVGLSIGMAVCLIIFLWVQDELGYDRFHTNKDEIVQVYSEMLYSSGDSRIFMGSYYPLARILKEECPEVREAIRYESASGLLLSHGEKQYTNDAVGLADTSFFDIFSFSFTQGNPTTALAENYSIVLTENMAKKYFGGEDPIGKTITLLNNFDLQVTGVIKDVPTQSSFQFDCIIPYALKYAPDFKEPEHWGGNPLNTYVLLYQDVDRLEVEQKITAIVEKHAQWETAKVTFHLHPLTKKHLYSTQGGGLIQPLLIFSAIALFILLIACINFMNLSTAKAATRAKEVGVRKVIGARKTDLVSQFIGESLMISLITLLIAIILLATFLPTLNEFLEKQFSLRLLLKPVVALGFLGIALFTGALAGAYPALYLSAFQPGNILKGLIRSGAKSSLRKVLVVVQFSLTIIMIIATVVLFRQLGFVMSTDLGFDRENLAVIQMSQQLQERFDPFKIDLLNNPQVQGVTRSLQGPWHIGSTVSAVEWDGKPPDETVSMHWDYVSYDYFATFGMDIIEGRAFSQEYSTDQKEAYIVNEEAVKMMGMESPVGERLSVFRNEGKIIGIVKNFHFQPLYHEVKPFVFMLRPNSGSLAFARIRPEYISGALDHITTTMKKIDPNSQVDLLFFNDVLTNYIYTTERRARKIAGYFTLLALLISSLGLFGLAAFMAERRTKEIGIRKVVGASVKDVVLMLSKDFTKWVLLSNIIAWPVAYFVMKKLLERYAYRTHIGWEIFVLSGLAALLIALLTVSCQAFKSARTNPADSLRYE